MGIHYKAYNCKLIIITIYFFVTFFIVCPNSRSVFADTSPLFVVEGIKVDVTAEDAVAAQEQAFAQAQEQAFRVLANRMVSDADVSTMKIPDIDTISSMINDYEVKNEQVSAVRYVGDFTFRFGQKAVNQYFSVSGVQYTDKKSRPLLILPVFQRGDSNTIWGQDNTWMQSWGSVELPTALVPVEVPIGDLDDVADIDDDNALRYERKSLDRMLLRYNAKEAAITIAIPDNALAGQKSLDDIAKGELRISIYRTDRGRAEYVSDLSIKPFEQESVGDMYERAVLKSYQALQKNWKTRTASSASQSTIYYTRMQIKNLNDLVQRRTLLQTLPGLSDTRVVSLMPVEAVLALTFRGDEARLREVLAGTDFSLSDAYENNQYDINSKVMYDLYHRYGDGNNAGNKGGNDPSNAKVNNEINQQNVQQTIEDPEVHAF